MKRLLLALCTLALIAGETLAECNCRHCVARRQAAASACPPGHRGHVGHVGHHGGNRGGQGFGAGYGQGGLFGNAGVMPAQSPTVVYPYYTTRAPRDFLSANPRGIGP